VLNTRVRCRGVRLRMEIMMMMMMMKITKDGGNELYAVRQQRLCFDSEQLNQ
jgi:hypothetical protein